MANQNKERYEFIEGMFNKLESLPPHIVIGKYIPLVQRGRHWLGLCPFHKDTKYGSFLVTPDKGIWKCFTCGDEYSGNAVKFVSLYKNLTYLEAAFDVALNHGLITSSEYDKYIKKRYDTQYVDSLQRRYSDNKKDVEKPVKASPEVIHNVCQTMKDMSPLSEAHRKSLEEERKLPKERIEKDYFSCPTNWRQKENIIAEIRNRFHYADDVLMTVPGFYYDKTHGKINFSGYKGLCILIRDASGMIQGIQIRKDTVKEADSRYVWFSSTFAFYRKDEFAGGCGCGSPKDVVWAHHGEKKKSICITEGRFKSEVLAANGFTTISIQGVSSWNGIIQAIEDVQNKQKMDAVNILIFLDSDIMGNHPLFEQSKKMCSAIQQRFPHVSIKYAFWKKSIGKGIDDYIHNNGKKCKYFDYVTANQVSDKAFQENLESFGITRLQDLQDKDIEPFKDQLQNELERLFGV